MAGKVQLFKVLRKISIVLNLVRIENSEYTEHTENIFLGKFV